jgi:hypothetical protein
MTVRAAPSNDNQPDPRNGGLQGREILKGLERQEQLRLLILAYSSVLFRKSILGEIDARAKS